MGCFSSLCKECGKPVNSDSFSGEHCTIYLLIDGKLVEEMTGQYDSYGRVFNGKKNKDGSAGGKDSFEWKYDKWGNLVTFDLNDKKNSGFAYVHTDCKSKIYKVPNTISKDDPNQGWGNYKYTTEGKPYHNVHKSKGA